ncbi:undecaprenyl-diphosphate phosphatase [Candidatus Desulforudis audaxviator]|uniref:Undecaprenyl-diphosphatase n=1 Tax=Desulforudis audaxviator (strain MP104C) TaxID=477974 RepID=UPPP_DESAP|nr:undecaprenyl-diphosphate phosphatase [Candidatus Desulforudis audaxviator]B1I2Y8.1 RecName: Full=Undecaprenyl-diphosphatase; AltName: Full=Bacitracin resistance protein; AltName: Full=Undecaprenyl pyrophosphate phosphatase [Candidatus Desulforudis audaxviator MP104C]ACA59349.1 putative undecaprenol kinase [Candidatus Desulforudis audaxviator MP104C]AZK59324.1 Undecaprenyl-diphosphatase [Candidatus Desulforudis audaxviator]
MNPFEGIVMGIVQGLTEFLPVSSSAHLVLVPWLFGFETPGLVFDVALHLGTLVAVLVYFWRDWLRLVQAGSRGVGTADGRLFWFLVVATIPGVVVGYFLEDIVETTLRAPLLIGVLLIMMGGVLYLADRYGGQVKRLLDIRFGDAMAIGLSQALAIIPGVSRSGITMATARLRGVERAAAARFSFLLSTPIIFGAGLMQMLKMDPGLLNLSFVLGVFTSAVVGFLAIWFLISWVSRHSFNIFVIYRVLLGLTVIVIALLRG